MKDKHIQLLDCTLRDGGMEIRTALKEGYLSKGFTYDDIHNVLKRLCNAGIDIIEAASVSEDGSRDVSCTVFGNSADVSGLIDYAGDDLSFAALYMGPHTDYSTIPYADEVKCKFARMMIRYSELDASLDLCRELADKGYGVFVQPSITMRYTIDELKKIVDVSNEIKAYALYIVDSYGYMDFRNVTDIYSFYSDRLNPGTRIGLHAHNNMNMAYSNVVNFISINTDRDLVVDSCLCGLGQGAGNLQTELIVPYLNKTGTGSYDYPEVLDACEYIDKFLNIDYSWGYSTARLIAALNRTSYKYGDVLRRKYNHSFREIYEILSNMPEEFRQRYLDIYAQEMHESFCNRDKQQ